MALVCAMSLNTQFCQAGASPAPMATLTVYNPNATSVAVTAIQISYFDAQLRPINAAAAPQLPAASPGQTVVVPTLSSITFGPMPVAVGSPASANSFWNASVSNTAATPNPQVALPPQTQVLIGGTVYGSDGSANTITPIGLTVSYTPAPPVLSQGGALQFASGNNLLTGLMMGVL